MAFDINRLKAVGASAAAKKPPAQKPVEKVQPLPETIMPAAQKDVAKPVTPAVPERASPDKKEPVPDKKTSPVQAETGEDTKAFSTVAINKVLSALVPAEAKEAKSQEDGNVSISMNVKDDSVEIPANVDAAEIPKGDTTAKAIDAFFGLPDQKSKLTVIVVDEKRTAEKPEDSKKDSIIGAPTDMPKENILDGGPGGDTVTGRIADMFESDEAPTDPVKGIKAAIAQQPEKGTALPETNNTSTIPPITVGTQVKNIFADVTEDLNKTPQETDGYTRDNVQATSQIISDDVQAPQELSGQTAPAKSTKPYTVQLDMRGNGARTDLRDDYFLQFSNSSSGQPGLRITIGKYVDQETHDSSTHLYDFILAKNGKTCKLNDKRVPFKLEVTIKWHKVQATDSVKAHTLLDKAEALVIPRKPNKAWEWTKKNAFGLTLGAFTVGTALVTNVFVPEVKQTVDASGMPEFLKSSLYPVLFPLAMAAFTAWSFVESKVHKKEGKKV